MYVVQPKTFQLNLQLYKKKINTKFQIQKEKKIENNNNNNKRVMRSLEFADLEGASRVAPDD